jgi:3-deoxy-D-manno-octulosonic-acid transferase
MGGTFHPRGGGHNILEATLLGKPVVVGPHRFSIVAQTELLAAAGGIVIADSDQALGAAVKGLLADPRRARHVGDAARLATLANQGAAGRVVDELLSVVAAE